MVPLLPRDASHLSSSMRVSNAAVMHFSHLGLPVRGLRRSQQFYSAYFGFDPATAQAYELCVDERGPAEQLANHLRRGFRQLMADRGADLAFGRTLPRRLRGAGLEQVAADGYFPLSSPAGRALEAATLEQVGDQLVAGGFATREQLSDHLDRLAEARIDVTMAPMISAWGMKPISGRRP